MVNLFVWKEAMASVGIDNDPDMQTMAEGLTNNPKLYRIIITIKDQKTDKIVWKGPLAHIMQARQRGILR